MPTALFSEKFSEGRALTTSGPDLGNFFDLTTRRRLRRNTPNTTERLYEPHTDESLRKERGQERGQQADITYSITYFLAACF